MDTQIPGSSCLKQTLIDEVIGLLQSHIDQANMMMLEFPIRLALYQKLAIFCFDHHQFKVVYPILSKVIYPQTTPSQSFIPDIGLLQKDLTLLLILAQLEYKLGNSDNCNGLCDSIIARSPQNIQALEMKGDICKHFCQIDQAFYYYSKAIESSQCF